MTMKNFYKILNTQFDIQAESRGVYLVRSGGSSTQPLGFPVDIQENLYQRELLAVELLKSGIISSPKVSHPDPLPGNSAIYKSGHIGKASI